MHLCIVGDVYLDHLYVDGIIRIHPTRCGESKKRLQREVSLVDLLKFLSVALMRLVEPLSAADGESFCC